MTNAKVIRKCFATAVIAACAFMCLPHETAQQKRSPSRVAEAMVPRGRPPAEHVFDADEGGWVHRETRRLFNADAHAEQVRAKKVACLRELYWERGGRQKRLARYVRKRTSKHSQQTLDSAIARAVHHTPQLGGGGEASAPGRPTLSPVMPDTLPEGPACTSPPSPPPSEQERGTSW